MLDALSLETRSRLWDHHGVELDLVTHDLREFVRLMLRRNGYVLEQLLSPLVVQTTPEHVELRDLAPGVLTLHHAHHYRGFTATQWRLLEKTDELKPLLYAFRAVLTGIHLMRCGEVQAHLPTLLEEVAECALEEARLRTELPAEPRAHAAPHVFVVRARLGASNLGGGAALGWCGSHLC